ncbi:MAG: helix-turn-helix transcriptional regulator [Rhodospirillales bacterium]|nr:helix-turn-helix transcriptional regulator [Rhodospirillales bacterium]
MDMSETSTSHGRTLCAIDAHVARRLRQGRIACGLSQKALARTLGLSFQQLQKYEWGVNRIGAGRLYRIAQALGVGIDWFFVDAAVPRQDQDKDKVVVLYSRGPHHVATRGAVFKP